MPPTKFLGTPYLQDPDLTIWNGDVREVLRFLPDNSVQMCVTSPPYLGLRDYGMDGQIGLEPSITEYVEAMVGVFAEVRRVLRKDGTLWLNIGDSYNAYNGGAGPSSKLSQTQSAVRPRLASGFGLQQKELKPKDLMMVPARVALALQADGWYLRSEITWCKPNPMPESVTDRPTQATEKVYLFSRSPRYFYDAEAVREEAAWERWGEQTSPKHGNSDQSGARWLKSKKPDGWATHEGGHGSFHRDGREKGVPAEVMARGRNLRNWWEIATEPYPEAHFATYPQELVRRCILAGSSERGCCPECGAPWVRETEGGEGTYATRKALGHDKPQNMVVGGHPGHHNGLHPEGMTHDLTPQAKATIGWRPTCKHSIEATAQTILDPFFGSGTTGLVARKHGRKCIGVELSPEYCALAARRLSQLSLLAEGAA